MVVTEGRCRCGGEYFRSPHTQPLSPLFPPKALSTLGRPPPTPWRFISARFVSFGSFRCVRSFVHSFVCLDICVLPLPSAPAPLQGPKLPLQAPHPSSKRGDSGTMRLPVKECQQIEAKMWSAKPSYELLFLTFSMQRLSRCQLINSQKYYSEFDYL